MGNAVQSFAASVANQLSEDPEEVGIISEWIALIMPLLNAWCNRRTPEEKRIWAAEHPIQARNRVLSAMRAKKPQEFRRRDAVQIADLIVEQGLMLSDLELRSLCEAAV